jgi:hypothetical protein
MPFETLGGLHQTAVKQIKKLTAALSMQFPPVISGQGYYYINFFYKQKIVIGFS